MPRLVSERGPALVSEDLNEHLDEIGIYHIYASPYHPQTNGKIEKWHKSLKTNVYVHSYDKLDDVFYGRRDSIVKKRSDKKIFTMNYRKEMNKIENKVMSV